MHGDDEWPTGPHPHPALTSQFSALLGTISPRNESVEAGPFDFFISPPA